MTKEQVINQYECCTEVKLPNGFRTLEFIGEIKKARAIKNAKMVALKSGQVILVFPDGEVIEIEELECYSEVTG